MIIDYAQGALIASCLVLVAVNFAGKSPRLGLRDAFCVAGALDKLRALLVFAAGLLALARTTEAKGEWELGLGISQTLLWLPFTLWCLVRDFQHMRRESLRINLVAGVNAIVSSLDVWKNYAEVHGLSIAQACVAVVFFLSMVCFTRDLGHMKERLKLVSPTESMAPLLDEESDATVRKKLAFEQQSKAGLLSQLGFFWLDPLIRLGMKRPLDRQDFYKPVSKDFIAYVAADFQMAYSASASAGVQGRRGSDIEKTGEMFPNENGNPWTLVRSFHRSGMLSEFYAAIPFQLAKIVLSFATPLILKELVKYLLEGSSHSTGEGITYAGLLFAVTVLSGVLLERASLLQFQSGGIVRGGLEAAVYDKVLRLTPCAKHASSNGQIMNLISSDCSEVENGAFFIPFLWESPLQIVGLVYLLWRELGWGILIGFGIVVCFVMPTTSFFMHRFEKTKRKMLEKSDTRVFAIGEVLTAMKGVKMYGWVGAFQERINAAREDELQSRRKYAFLVAGDFVCWLCSPVLLSLISFGSFVLLGGNLTAPIVVTSFTLLLKLEDPISSTAEKLSQLLEVFVSLRRLASFLQGKEFDPELLSKVYMSQPSGNVALQIQDGTFYWDDARTLCALKEITLEIRRGETCIVTGEVGSGKSAFLRAILGEIVPGADPLPIVQLNGSVGYASQVPWIRNTTLRENILFGSVFDEAWYCQVVSACGLEQDLAHLPNGDATLIGERGINLSGGQKARIALARAVYSPKDILLLETCFEAVDEHVATHIWQHCFRGLLLRPHPFTQVVRTVILVTHALRFAPEADRVCVFQSGQLVQNGDFSSLMSQGHGGCLTRLLQKQQTLSQSQNQAKVENTSTEIVSSSEAELDEPKALSTENEEDDLEEGVIVGQVHWTVYEEYFRALGGNCTLVVFVVTALVRCCMEAGAAAWIGAWSSRKLSEPDLGYFLGVFVGLTAFRLVTVATLVLVVLLSSLRASRTLHADLLQAIVRAKMKFFDTTPTGRILNRFSNDMHEVDDSIPRLLLDVFESSATLLCPVLLCLSIAPQILPVLVLAVLAIKWLQGAAVATSRQVRRWSHALRSPVFHHFSESLAGLETIRAFSATIWFEDQLRRVVSTSVSAEYLSLVLNRWLSVRLEFICSVLVGCVALSLVFMKDSINPAFGGLVLAYILNATGILGWQTRTLSKLETDIVSVERIHEYISLEQEPDAAASLPMVLSSFAQSGRVVFESVTARYRQELGDVVTDLSIDIRGGEKIGIVGRTGSGKSTLFGLLLRLLEPRQGRILIDGVDIRDVGLDLLRQSCSIIPQDPVMFNGTLRLNLDPLGLYDDEALWIALSHVQLDQFVRSLSGALDAHIAEAGSNLSFGQRQLICIARAILRGSKIILCDEATSGIDNATDDLVHDTIRREFVASTVLTIAHRLGTILESDRVLVMSNGTVAEFAPPSHLLQDPDSHFSSLLKQSQK